MAMCASCRSELWYGRLHACGAEICGRRECKNAHEAVCDGRPCGPLSCRPLPTIGITEEDAALLEAIAKGPERSNASGGRNDGR